MTLAEINAAPIDMRLNRVTWISDSSGGSKPGPPSTLTSQRVTLIAPTQQLPERRTIAGITVVPEYLLKGKHDADIQRGDWYFVDGVKYEIVFVYPDRRYQTKAEVVYLG
jgi:hypothetical protein